MHHPCPRRIGHDRVLCRRTNKRDGAASNGQGARAAQHTRWCRRPANTDVARTRAAHFERPAAYPNRLEPADARRGCGWRDGESAADPERQRIFFSRAVWTRGGGCRCWCRRETGREAGYRGCGGDDECAWRVRAAGAFLFWLEWARTSPNGVCRINMRCSRTRTIRLVLSLLLRPSQGAGVNWLVNKWSRF